MSDKIEIRYFETNADALNGGPLSRLVYAEWKRNGVPEMAYASEEDDAYRRTADAGLHEIPDDVREEIALKIAPSLLRWKTNAVEVLPDATKLDAAFQKAVTP